MEKYPKVIRIFAEYETELHPVGETDRWEHDDLGFKRVRALEKCFAILDLINGSERPLGVSEISRRLRLNKHTVLNIVRNLADLEVLEQRPDSKLVVGTRLYVLGKASGSNAELARVVHPYLRTISSKSTLPTFLAVRSGRYAVIIDKAEAVTDLAVSYEIGTRLPLHVGAAGKALMCRFSDAELEDILREREPLRSAPHAYKEKALLRAGIRRTPGTNRGNDVKEQIDRTITLAVPIRTPRADFQAAILVGGLNWQWRGGCILSIAKLLRETAEELECRFSSA